MISKLLFEHWTKFVYITHNIILLQHLYIRRYTECIDRNMIVFYAYFHTTNAVLNNIIIVIKWEKIYSKYDQQKTIIKNNNNEENRRFPQVSHGTSEPHQSSSRVGETGSIFIGGGVVVVVAADISSAGLATAIMLPPLDDIICKVEKMIFIIFIIFGSTCIGVFHPNRLAIFVRTYWLLARRHVLVHCLIFLLFASPSLR